MGDDDATFNGLRGVISKFIFSAWDGYANFGSDIGGYRTAEDGSNDRYVFTRWAQLGAFVPLMENGGGGIHKPWEYDEEVSDIYRKFVTEHYRLSSYLHTTGSYAALRGTSSLTPLASRDESKPWKFEEPSTFSYLLGPDLLVHPVVSNNTVGSFAPVTLTFPAVETGQIADSWLDWWRPTDASRIKFSGMEETRELVAFDSYPVYVRRGALMPLDEKYGASSPTVSPVQFTWFGPVEGSSTSADVLEPSEEGPGVHCKVALSADGQFTGSITAHSTRQAGWTIVGVSEPSSIEFGTGLCRSSYHEQSLTFKITCANIKNGLTVTATGMKAAIAGL